MSGILRYALGSTRGRILLNNPMFVVSSRSKHLETHTGQSWDESDVRNVRFTNSDKQINTKFAIDLISKIPPIEVTGKVVACDGGGGALGHPKIYINVEDGKPTACIYCQLRYVLKKH